LEEIERCALDHEIASDQDPAKAIETLVERVVLERDLTCRMFYKAVPKGRVAICGVPKGIRTPVTAVKGERTIYRNPGR